jgi:chromosome segregation ATPase
MNKDSDPEVINRTIAYLNAMKKDIFSYGYNEEIAKQEDKLKDLEKDLKKSIKNGESLNRDKAKTENKATENRNEIGQLKANMDNQNKTLEFVKAKTGTVDQMNAIKKEISKQEDAVKSATKKYENALKDDEDYKADIQKTISKIGENQTEQVKIKSEIESVKATINEIKAKLAAL